MEGRQIEFVEPEPSSGPPPYDERYIPLWVKIAVAVAAIAVAAVAITVMAR